MGIALSLFAFSLVSFSTNQNRGVRKQLFSGQTEIVVVSVQLFLLPYPLFSYTSVYFFFFDGGMGGWREEGLFDAK